MSCSLICILQTREVPLDEEEWYHGALPRIEAETHLINDGDFLVREKSDASGQIVLSARAEGRVRHFPIQKNAEVTFSYLSHHKSGII